jgi:hypothetical protein
MIKKIKEVKKVKEAEYTDIIHEVRDGVLYDVYLNGKKEVKIIESKE